MKKLVAIVLGVALAGVGTVALATRNASGTHTLPAGNPVVSGTSISTTWANNTLGDISQALTDSLDRNGKGGMLAPLRTTNGSVSAPSHSFTNDTDTGLYLVGDANPALTVAGTQRQAWSSTGSSVTGTFSVSGASTLTGNTTVGGTLGVTGAATAAGLTSTSGATISSGDVALTQAAGQSIAKSGGSLTISAAGANEIAFYTNGAQAGSFLSTGNLWMNLKRIENVAAPTDAGDAANKAYVDARASTAGKIVAGGQIDASAGAPVLNAGFGTTNHVRNSVGNYTITLSASYANNTPIVTLHGAGYAVVTTAAGSFTAVIRDGGGALADTDFSFIVVGGP